VVLWQISLSVLLTMLPSARLMESLETLLLMSLHGQRQEVQTYRCQLLTPMIPLLEPNRSSLMATFASFSVSKDHETAFLQFVCGPTNSSVPNAFNVTEDDSTCTFVTTLVSPTGCSGGSSGGGGGSSDDLSGGSVFIIILVVVIPVYIIVGCIYKWRVNGTSGIESCPNIEFWRDLPHLVKDGFSYTMSGCKKGSDSHYDEL